MLLSSGSLRFECPFDSSAGFLSRCYIILYTPFFIILLLDSVRSRKRYNQLGTVYMESRNCESSAWMSCCHSANYDCAPRHGLSPALPNEGRESQCGIGWRRWRKGDPATEVNKHSNLDFPTTNHHIPPRKKEHTRFPHPGPHEQIRKHTLTETKPPSSPQERRKRPFHRRKTLEEPKRKKTSRCRRLSPRRRAGQRRAGQRSAGARATRIRTRRRRTSLASRAARALWRNLYGFPFNFHVFRDGGTGIWNWIFC